MRTGFYIEGGEQLAENLGTLGNRIAKTVVRQAVRAAQGPMLRQAIANARGLPHSEKQLFVAGKRGEEDIRMAELIARNIVIAAPRRQKPGTYALHVQLRRDVPEFLHHSPRTGKDSYIPAAIEFGHGADPQRAARPFMRPAATGTMQEVLRVLSEELGNGILREAITFRYTQSQKEPTATIPGTGSAA